MKRVYKKKHIYDWIVPMFATLAGFIVVFPVIYCVLSAFKAQGEFITYPPTLLPESFLNFDNFRAVFEKTPVLRFMLNSFIVAMIGTAVRIVFASLAAFALAFFEFRGKKLMFILVLATMMLPGDALIITNYLTVSKLGLMDSYLGMSITSFVGATQMFILRQHFKTIPREYHEAAQIDGCNEISFILKILIPMSRPILATLTTQSFVTLWNAYLWPLLVTNKTDMRTVQVGVTMLTTVNNTNYSLVMAAVAIVLIPSFILFGLMRKNLVEGMSTGALVG